MKEKSPPRKSIRLKNYDYSLEGYYFITICTKYRRKLMSVVGVDVHGDPQIKLTSIGRIIEKYIEDCNKKISKIYIDEYIIMPNHIHFIILINGSPWTSTPTILKNY